MSARTLYRPVGLRELELILEGDARRFPPRLPEQPIFYPVLTREYAIQIARDWNAPHPPGFAGFVTEFELEAEYVGRFEVRRVGATQHEELWVPAEQLDELNEQLRSRIRTPLAFYGAAYQGPTPLPFGLRTPNAREQLRRLHAALQDSGMDFVLEIAANWRLILVNYGFWCTIPAEEQGLARDDAARTLAAIADVWGPARADLVLPTGTLVTGS